MRCGCLPSWVQHCYPPSGSVSITIAQFQVLGGPKEGWGTVRHTFLISSWYMTDGEGHMEGYLFPHRFPGFCKRRIELKIDLYVLILSPLPCSRIMLLCYRSLCNWMLHHGTSSYGNVPRISSGASFREAYIQGIRWWSSG